MHFPDYNFTTSYQLMETNLGDHKSPWTFCFIGYVAGKFLGFTLLTKFIDSSWKCKANVTLHDFDWLIYSFSSETNMLAVLSDGPYFVFGRPLILKIMPDYFDFTAFDMVKMSVWVRFPNLPLKC